MQINENLVTWLQDGEDISQAVLNTPLKSLMQEMGNLSLLDELDGNLIKNASIPSGKINGKAVLLGNIQDGAVDKDALGENSIYREHIKNGEVTLGKLGVGQVGSVNIVDGQIDSDHIQTNQIITHNIVDNNVSLNKLQKIAPLTILGNNSSSPQNVQEIQSSQLQEILNFKSQQFYDVGEEVEEVMQVGQFNIGVFDEQEVEVLLFDNEDDYDDFEDDIEDGIITEPNHDYDYGKINDLPQGFYSLGANHPHNPTKSEQNPQDGSLIVTMNKESFQNFIFQTIGSSTESPRIFIQNTRGSNFQGGVFNWVELVHKNNLNQLITQNNTITQLNNRLTQLEGRVDDME